MKRLIYILTIILICGTVTIPEISASERGRSEQSSRSGRGGRTSSSDRSSSSRQSSSRSSRENRGGSSSSNRTNRPSSGKDNGSYRPGNSGNSGNHSGSYNPGSGRDNRPSTGKDNGSYRPGNSGNHDNHGNHSGNSGSYRPGNSGHHGNHGNNGSYRPGNSGHHDNHGNHGNNGSYRPGNSGHHDNHGSHSHGGNGYRPRPEYNGHHYGHISRPPHRPYRPAPIVYHRPAPPVYYHPHCHITPLQALIGVTLGVAFDASVNVFLGRNYFVDGYDNDYLYMRDLYAYNYSWPDVMLYYSNGYLASSQFRYSTSYYDCGRYNSIYNQLYASYGAPAILQNISGGRRVTWWGYNNNYITLEFLSEYTTGYGTRYYTNLIIGR